MKTVPYLFPAVAGVWLLRCLHTSGVETSDPLDTWNKRSQGPSSLELTTVGYGNGFFVAAGIPGTIVSGDGASWTNTFPSGFSSAAFGNGVFLAAGYGASIKSSADGTNWITRQIGTTANLSGVAFGNGVFVVSGETASVWVSSGGVNWTRVSLPGILSRIAFGNGMFVGVGEFSFTSRDGLTWAKGPPPPAPVPQGLTFGDGRFIGVGSSGSIYTSINGTNWISRGWGSQENFRNITFGNGFFVLVGNGGTIFTSIDSVNWTGRHSGAQGNLMSVAYGAGSFVAVSDRGEILQSRELQTVNQEPSLSIGFYPGLTIQGQPGRLYRIESTDALIPPQWRTLATAISPASEFFWTDFESVNRSNRFYRVELVP